MAPWAAGGDVLLVLTQPATGRIFKVTGADRYFTIFDTLSGAVTAAPGRW